MNFVRVAKVVFKHDFYTDNVCTDLEVQPDPVTEMLLKNHRHLIRTRPNGMDIFAESAATGDAKDDQPLLPLSDGTKLRFWLRLRDLGFDRFTDLSGHDGLGPRLGFECDAGETAIPAMIEGVATDRFVVGSSEQNEIFELKNTPRDHVDRGDFEVTANGVVQVNTYDADTNSVSVDTTAVPAGTAISLSYPINAKKISGVFAELVLSAPDWSPPTTGGTTAYETKKFKVQFKARKVVWTYAVVAGGLSNGAEYSIQDTDTNGLDFRAFSKDEVLQPALTVPKNDQGTNNSTGAGVFLFRSVKPVTCAQRPRRGLRLVRSTPISEPSQIITSLPNPMWGGTVHIALNNGKQIETFISTIKYLPQPLSKK